jgi:hypothetical protein
MAGPFDRDDPSSVFSKWSRVAANEGESCRWQSVDGRWVALSVGTGQELGVAFVSDSSGRRERADNFEHALQLAKEWRRS